MSRKKYFWSESDDQVMREHYHKMGARLINMIPDKSVDAIWERAAVLGLSKGRGGFGRRLNAATIDTSRLTATHLAYIAGIIDGEGHIRFGQRFGQEKYHNGKCFGTRITVTNTHYPVLLWLRDKLGGGHIAQQAKATETRKACWHWGLWRVRDCYTLAKALLPYSIIKQRDLESLIAFCEEEFCLQYDDLVQSPRAKGAL